MPFNKIAELGMELGKGQVFINQLQGQIQQLQEEIEKLKQVNAQQAGTIGSLRPSPGAGAAKKVN